MDGEWIRELLESVGWGSGASHMAVLPDPAEPCGRCHGTRRVGSGRLKIACPDCMMGGDDG
jgi:hypothetical protein